jgi:protein-disulfide isomerase
MRITGLVVMGGLFTSLMSVGCIHTLGRPPSDVDLYSDGSEAGQEQAYRRYEVVLDRGMVRRPGISAEGLRATDGIEVDYVDAPAWSDDAYNYLSSSDEAAAALENPAVAFDQFNNNGLAPALLLGVGAAVGVVGGAVTWFIPTGVSDGLTQDEVSSLALLSAGGMVSGVVLGAVVGTAYGLLGPALSGPLATPSYRAATRAFNDDLDVRVDEGSGKLSSDSAVGEATPVPVPGEPLIAERMAAAEAEIELLKALAPRPRAEPAPQTEARSIPVGDSPILGPPSAPIEVVIFTDLQCPFCARVHPLLLELMADEGLKGKVKVVFKHFPLHFHVNARPLAKGAMAARALRGDAGFWDYVAKVYDNQQAGVEDVANGLKLPLTKFNRAITDNDAKYEAIMDADIALGTTVNVRGTPTLFVNGWELRTRSVDGVKAVIADHNLLNTNP